MKKNPRRKEANPPRRLIYERIREIVATKGPGHRCDAACRRARHTYVHRFKRKVSIFGLKDGKLAVE
jgi:hypothetical protein